MLYKSLHAQVSLTTITLISYYIPYSFYLLIRFILLFRIPSCILQTVVSFLIASFKPDLHIMFRGYIYLNIKTTTVVKCLFIYTVLHTFSYLSWVLFLLHLPKKHGDHCESYKNHRINKP